MTLPDFLLARINDDEQFARRELAMVLTPDLGPRWLSLMTRTLLECEAKRRIVGLAPKGTCNETHPTQDIWHGDDHEAPILLALAAVYADHPDYRQEWRP